jgi:hypothetical protein
VLGTHGRLRLLPIHPLNLSWLSGVFYLLGILAYSIGNTFNIVILLPSVNVSLVTKVGLHFMKVAGL